MLSLPTVHGLSWVLLGKKRTYRLFPKWSKHSERQRHIPCNTGYKTWILNHWSTLRPEFLIQTPGFVHLPPLVFHYRHDHLLTSFRNKISCLTADLPSPGMVCCNHPLVSVLKCIALLQLFHMQNLYHEWSEENMHYIFSIIIAIVTIPMIQRKNWREHK